VVWTLGSTGGGAGGCDAVLDGHELVSGGVCAGS
jgi:hypothetical protein